MRAVWSFWSRPFEAYKHGIWLTPLHHLLAWGLSLQAARRHYPETVLVTDLPGKTLLIDRLGLQFAEVTTELERLRDVDPGWWALGKLVAHSLQDRPYVHIDTDVFLWKPLPPALIQAPVFAQCPEYWHPNNSADSPAAVEKAFEEYGTSLPVEWEWARSHGGMVFKEENCGILGGTNLPFLRYYARGALDLVTGPEYQAAWARLPSKQSYNMIVEQFFLSACIDFHRFHPNSPFRGVHVKHLFPSWAEAFDTNRAARAGFTHLLGEAKANPAVGRRLEERMRQEDPGYYRRCRMQAA